MKDSRRPNPLKDNLVQNAGGDTAENSSDHAGSFAKTSDKNSGTNCKGNALPVLILKEKKALAPMTRSISQGGFQGRGWRRGWPLMCNP